MSPRVSGRFSQAFSSVASAFVEEERAAALVVALAEAECTDAAVAERDGLAADEHGPSAAAQDEDAKA